jgi:hypothetical protein
MADETSDSTLDDILDTTEDTTTQVPDKVEITKDELARFVKSAEQADRFEETVSALTEQIDALRNQRSAPVNTEIQDTGLTADAFFQDPEAAIKKVLNKQFAAELGPLAERALGNVAGVSIDSFRSLKRSDPLFAGVEPIFEKEVGQLNKSWLGRLTNEQLTQTLNKAWDASVGAYVQVERAKKVASKAKNLSSSTGGGTTTAKTLAEINPAAYRTAMQGGLSDEDMAEIAKSLIEEEE